MNKQALIWGSSKRKKGELWAFFLYSMLLWLSRACTRTKFPHSYQKRWLIFSRWPTWPLGPQQPLFSNPRLPPTSVDCPLLLTPLGLCLSSSFSGLIGNLARKPFVWVSPQNRQRNPQTGTHLPLHPQNECTHIVPQSSLLFNFGNLAELGAWRVI